MPIKKSIIFKYFPCITEQQRTIIDMLGYIYKVWNARLNLVSRPDLDMLYERHILHSMAIAKCIQFPSHSKVLDIGTGGGFPGIPLAIMFPLTYFTLVDSIGKKIRAVNEITKYLGLNNIETIQARVEDLHQKFDYAVCRAVAPLTLLLSWLDGNIKDTIFCLKGGDLTKELIKVQHQTQIFEISQWFNEDFFVGKKIVLIKPNTMAEL